MTGTWAPSVALSCLIRHLTLPRTWLVLAITLQFIASGATVSRQ